MKNKLILFLLALTAVSAYGQKSEFGHNQIKNEEAIMWFGIDFTHAKLVGAHGFNDPHAIVDEYFDKWNDLIIKERSRYDIPGAFKKKKWLYDLSIARSRNAEVDPDELVTEDPHELDAEDIDEIVSHYKTAKKKEGVGLVYIVENFNKTMGEAQIWAVLVDLSDASVLSMKRYTGEPGGFGLRNYWASCIEEMIESMADDYNRWLKKNK